MRACWMSGLTWTRVSVTNPMPGSWTSRASSWANSPRIWSATRSGLEPWDTPLNAHHDALHDEHFDDVADLDVVEAFEADAALEARLHLARIVLESSERPDLAFVDDDVVAQQTRLCVARARDAAFGHHAAGNRAELRDFERLANLRRADANLLERRIEEARHRLLHLIGHVVDDRVRADFDAFARRDVFGVAVRPDVERNDDGVRCGREQHVRFVDRADARVDDSNLHFFIREFRQRVGEHFGRALHIALDDDREL